MRFRFFFQQISKSLTITEVPIIPTANIVFPIQTSNINLTKSNSVNIRKPQQVRFQEQTRVIEIRPNSITNFFNNMNIGIGRVRSFISAQARGYRRFFPEPRQPIRSKPNLIIYSFDILDPNGQFISTQINQYELSSLEYSSYKQEVARIQKQKKKLRDQVKGSNLKNYIPKIYSKFKNPDFFKDTFFGGDDPILREIGRSEIRIYYTYSGFNPLAKIIRLHVTNILTDPNLRPIFENNWNNKFNQNPNLLPLKDLLKYYREAVDFALVPIYGNYGEQSIPQEKKIEVFKMLSLGSKNSDYSVFEKIAKIYSDISPSFKFRYAEITSLSEIKKTKNQISALATAIDKVISTEIEKRLPLHATMRNSTSDSKLAQMEVEHVWEKSLTNPKRAKEWLGLNEKNFQILLNTYPCPTKNFINSPSNLRLILSSFHSFKRRFYSYEQEHTEFSQSQKDEIERVFNFRKVDLKLLAQDEWQIIMNAIKLSLHKQILYEILGNCIIV